MGNKVKSGMKIESKWMRIKVEKQWKRKYEERIQDEA